jgi:hypothetical protein
MQFRLVVIQNPPLSVSDIYHTVEHHGLCKQTLTIYVWHEQVEEAALHELRVGVVVLLWWHRQVLTTPCLLHSWPRQCVRCGWSILNEMVHNFHF